MSEKLSVKVKTKELLEAIKIVENFISRKKWERNPLKEFVLKQTKKKIT